MRDPFVCRSCDRLFRSLRAFDFHRSGPPDDRICVDPFMIKKRDGSRQLMKNEHGEWYLFRPDLAPKGERLRPG